MATFAAFVFLARAHADRSAAVGCLPTPPVTTVRSIATATYTVCVHATTRNAVPCNILQTFFANDNHPGQVRGLPQQHRVTLASGPPIRTQVGDLA